MRNTLSIALTIGSVIIGSVAATAPAQSATRLMISSFEGFQYRCEHHGGVFAKDGAVLSCNTPSVPVSCEYFEGRRATCVWPGIERQIDVIRVIGTLPGSFDIDSSSGQSGGKTTLAGDLGNDGDNGGGGNGGGGNGGGGGFQGPQDFKAAPPPQEDPKPNFNGPQDFQLAP